jgi:alpha-tubulin suppressor-like RCC1 family protein
MSRLPTLGSLASLLLACAPSPDFGPADRPPAATTCVPGGCEPGQVCVGGVCVVEIDARDAATGPDASASDGGEPTDEDASRPTSALGCDVDFVDLSVGNDTACGVTTTGDVWCWGRTQCDQIPGQPGSDTPLPVRVAAAPLVRIADHVDDHVCGLDADGAVYCWGCDYGNMLADFDGGPADPFAGGPFVDVATTWVGTCLARDSGVLRCFGDDANGQLACAPSGAVDTTCDGELEAPTAFEAVSIHQRFGCGVSGGEAWCWGLNDVGQLGRGSYDSEPQAPGLVNALTNVVDVSVGINHGCALDDAGSLYCWGQNTHGQLGIGGGGNATEPQSLDSTWERVRAGTNHVCAIDTGGELYCWGSNNGGRLGVGDEEERDSPTRVDGSWTEVAAGANSTCAIDDEGRVHCWGSNDDGKLGTGVDDTELEGSLTPLPIACD